MDIDRLQRKDIDDAANDRITLAIDAISTMESPYILDDVEIDIDSWPLIPTYVEIEGKDEKSVMSMVDKLELDKTKLTALDVMSVYDQIYNIDMNKIKELNF